VISWFQAFALSNATLYRYATEYGQSYGVTGFPTLMLFQDGRPVGQKTGLIDMATAMKYAGVKDAGVLVGLALFTLCMPDLSGLYLG
jgi:hypothetical protein